MKHSLKLFILTILMVAVTACESNTDVDKPGSSDANEYKEMSLSGNWRDYSRAEQDFSFKLLGQVYSDSQYKEVCISPMSAYMLLSMLDNGCDVSYNNALNALLGVSAHEDGVNQLNTYNNEILTQICNLDKTTQLKICNSFWTSDISLLNSNFKSNLASQYNTEFVNISPAGETGRNAINKWVAKNTDNVIDRFLKNPLDCNSSIINVMLFRGKWLEPFEKEATTLDSFTNSEGVQSSIRFMNNTLNTLYYSDNGYQRLYLPYGNRNFTFNIILPPEGVSLEDAIDYLEKGNFSLLPTSLNSVHATVSMPKISANSEIDLYKSLSSLGISEVLEIGLTSVFNNSTLAVNMFKQAISLTVDEDGSEATAATIAGGITDSRPDEVMFIANRPFIYFIQEASSGVILIAGTFDK